MLPQSEIVEFDQATRYSQLITTNRLRVIPSADIRTDPVRVFEVLSSAGEIQQIDFSSVQIDSVVSVNYFDLRCARRALSELRSDFKSIEPDAAYDSSSARSVRINRDSGISLDDTMAALSKYGEIERLSFAGSDQLVVEFFDTRAPLAVLTALGTTTGESSRRASYTNPPSVVSNGTTAAFAVSQTADSSEFEFKAEKILSGIDTRTTLMIRNIPNKYSQKLLIRLIDLRFKDKYDFFYLPIDYKNKCNVGYAFINFNSNCGENMVEFFSLFNGKKWEKFNSEKICKISFARLQGQDALIDHFKSSSVMQQHKQLRPYFVRQCSSTGGAPIATPPACAESPPPGLSIDPAQQPVLGDGGESFIGSETGSQFSSFLVSTNPGTVEGAINLSLKV